MAPSDFDDEFRGVAKEVRNIGAAGSLAAELESVEAMAAQGAPELAFGLGHLSTELAGEGDFRGFGFFHGPLPIPLPRGRDREGEATATYPRRITQT